MNLLWDFQSITWQGYVTLRVILCRDEVCGLDLTRLITISFAPRLRHKEKQYYSAGSPLKTSVQHFLPELTQLSKTFTPSEEVHNIPGETSFYCLWIREKCLSLPPIGLRMFKMLHLRFISITSCQASLIAFWCYCKGSKWSYSQY